MVKKNSVTVLVRRPYTMNSRRILIFFVVVLWKFEAGNFADIYQDEIESLSELPLDRLIKIKSSIAPILGRYKRKRKKKPVRIDHYYIHNYVALYQIKFILIGIEF